MAVLEIDLQRRGTLARLMLGGELDLSTVEEAEDRLSQLEAQRPDVLVLDLANLNFLDSSGLRLVVSADQRARAEGRRFVVVRGSEIVQRVFAITHLEDEIEVVDSFDELQGV